MRKLVAVLLTTLGLTVVGFSFVAPTASAAGKCDIWVGVKLVDHSSPVRSTSVPVNLGPGVYTAETRSSDGYAGRSGVPAQGAEIYSVTLVGNGQSAYIGTTGDIADGTETASGSYDLGSFELTFNATAVVFDHQGGQAVTGTPDSVNVDCVGFTNITPAPEVIVEEPLPELPVAACELVTDGIENADVTDVSCQPELDSNECIAVNGDVVVNEECPAETPDITEDPAIAPCELITDGPEGDDIVIDTDGCSLPADACEEAITAEPGDDFVACEVPESDVVPVPVVCSEPLIIDTDGECVLPADPCVDAITAEPGDDFVACEVPESDVVPVPVVCSEPLIIDTDGECAAPHGEPSMIEIIEEDSPPVTTEELVAPVDTEEVITSEPGQEKAPVTLTAREIDTPNDELPVTGSTTGFLGLVAFVFIFIGFGLTAVAARR